MSRVWRYALAALLGGVIAVVAEHGLLRLMQGPKQVVEVTEPFKVFADDQLVANIGVGTRAEMLQEGPVRWLFIRVSFAEKDPPFRAVPGEANPGGEVHFERGSI